ncbi:hypothetical protein GCM10007415_33950 [Parapedobacter pyrenivorans]|uniref:DUF6265 domain-containing protein n=1 Tax=Parapedobacter pyrenivorans TaxID=1305674 RepID=A0A917MCM9_9SPHI|nr:DUF6265 family protein [Parapedobacter pyrenivorans]GGG95927.1 hypothetical protein GCM10007415_33950 [Parapedobacter pyrenivorans]
MKLLVLLSFAVLVPCGQAENFDFMIGEWERTNEGAGKRTFETWVKQNDFTYLGHSYTLQGADTVWQEHTMLSPIAGVWHLKVRLMGETQSTDFKITQSDGGSFTCENPQNEFPKTIRYQRAGAELHAEISGGGDPVAFLFAPVDK